MNRPTRILGIITLCFITIVIISFIITEFLPNGVLRGFFNVLYAVSIGGSLVFGTIFFGAYQANKEDNAQSSYKLEEKRSRTIPKHVQREVWRRDMGRCIECGSQERLEYDHIIPFSKGGSNTARNIQLLCERCNRKKNSKIGR